MAVTAPYPPPSPAESGAARTPLTALDWLRWFGAQSGATVPAPATLPAAAMPAPYRQLLAHGQDMTSTLERFYETRLGLRALRRERHGAYYVREVLLTAGELPVEYGVICIRLAAFPPALRQEILAERLPLGRLLQDHQQPCLCRPQEFFHWRDTPWLRSRLNRPAPRGCYGRRNLLLNAGRRLLADVVEILSPAAEERPQGRLPVDWSACFGQAITGENVV